MDVRRTSGYLPVANILAGRVIAAICIVLFHFAPTLEQNDPKGVAIFPVFIMGG